MEQLSMEFVELPDEEVIRDALVREINNAELTKYLVVEVLKSGILSIRANSNVCARIKLNQNTHYIEVKSNNIDLFKVHLATGTFQLTDINSQKEADNNNWARIVINTIDDVLLMSKPLSMIFVLVLTKAGAGFGCCSRYMQCSDAKKCVHPDLFTSLACGYRRNLEDGRIFYGKNKNI